MFLLNHNHTKYYEVAHTSSPKLHVFLQQYCIELQAFMLLCPPPERHTRLM